MVRAVEKNRRLSIDLAAAALAGGALWAAFPDVGAWWLVVPALALVIARVEGARAVRAALIGAVFGASFWLPHIVWAIPATGGWLPWVALSVTQLAWFALWAWLVALLRGARFMRNPLGAAVAVASLWVGIEQLRSSWPWSGFPWGNLAFPQVDAPIGRLAPIGGEVLVSFAVVVCAVLLRRSMAMLADLELQQWWGRPACLAGAVAIFVVPTLVPLPNAQEAGAVRVGAVQGNIELPAVETYSVEGKVAGNHAGEHVKLTDVDLIVWGESALDRDPRRSAIVRSIVANAIDEVGVPTLLGLPEYDGEVRWNWVGMWYPGSGLDESTLYGKQVPVPFGEFIPWRSVISRLATEAAQVQVDLAAADNPAFVEATLADGRSLPLSVGICFEVAYESLLAEGVRMGGQILVIPTNNYHFRTLPQPAQQAQILRFRAMEFSRSGVQASTTGESVLIRPDGSVLASTDRMVAAHIAGELPLRTTLTPAARFAEFWHYGALGVGAVVALVALANGLNASHPKKVKSR